MTQKEFNKQINSLYEKEDGMCRVLIKAAIMRTMHLCLTNPTLARYYYTFIPLFMEDKIKRTISDERKKRKARK